MSLKEIMPSDETCTVFADRGTAESIMKGRMEAYEYSDNFRSAWADDQEEVKAYVTKYNNGCCGYADFRVTVAQKMGSEPKFRELLCGWNYGH